MTEVKKMPVLTFPEFDSEWIIRKFGDLLISSRLGGNYSNSEKNNSKPLIKMGNLDRGCVKLDKLDYINEDEQINETDRLQFGDLLFNTRNTLDLVGKVAIWKSELPIAYYNSNIMYIKFSNNFFMNYRLNSFQSIKGLRRLATGTTSVAAIYTKDLLNLKLYIPNEILEQQKIASFLTSVDDKIQQLTRKKTLLEQYKKGVMQKIFSQEIRFKDDEGNEFPEWQTLKLNDFLKLTLRQVNKPKNNYLAIGIRSHCKGTFQKLDFDPEKIAMEKLFLVKENDLIVNITFAWEGAIALAKKEDDGGLVSHRFPTYTFNSEIVLYDYFRYVFIQKRFRLLLELISPGGAGRNRVMSKKDFLLLKTKIPIIGEQEKIANFLTTIDKKIELVNTQLIKTQTFKKGLLQQMFV
jgi:type I restriction enzyme S subunit